PATWPVAVSKVRPGGRVPVKLKVGAGKPLAVNAKSYGDPTTAFGSVPLVKTGASFTVRVTSSVAVPPALVAATVNACSPPVPAAGVPVNPPAALRVSPDGSVPELTANVGAGFPVAVKLKLYGAPTVADGGAALVKAGGTTTSKCAVTTLLAWVGCAHVSTAAPAGIDTTTVPEPVSGPTRM